MARPGPALFELAKVAIRRRITELFNDASRGERPILRRADALFAPDSVAWRVNGDIVTMMIGGVSGLLLQMLHPAVLAGVWDHSDRVRGIHDRLGGVLPDGTPYRAGDPALLAWVHVTEAASFLNAWIRYAEPDMSAGDQDRYFAEMAVVADRLGAAPVPRDHASAEALIQSMRPALRADARTRGVAQLVLNQSVGAALTDTASGVIMSAGVDLLPDWARAMHGLQTPPAPIVRAGAHALAGALGWAYAGSPNHEVWPGEVTAWPRG